MKRFKAALKVALVPGIIGLVAGIPGAILLLLGLFGADALLWVGIPLFSIGAVAMVIAIANYKQRLHAICPECNKYMGDTGGVINYSYVCTEYKDNYDSSTHQYKNTTFYYTCSIECPHCGSTHTFDYSVNAKTESEANVKVNNYIKNTLKLKK